MSKILQKWGVENKNGRIYPKDVLVLQVKEYQKLVAKNAAERSIHKYNK